MKHTKIYSVAVAFAIGLLGLIGKAKADPAKPYRFDVRTIAGEMCNEFLGIPTYSIEDVEGCKASYDHCVTTLADLAAATADFKHFYRESPYVYLAGVADYFVFEKEFRDYHFYIRMTRFDDSSGLEIPMTTSFELTYIDLKDDVGSTCKLTPIFPVDLCGNGVKDAGESCDDGADNGKPGKCPDSCKFEVMQRLRIELPLVRYDFLKPKL